MFKSGFVNIIGYPNAGKSTLINCLLNDKLSIITEKAQTTRHKIIGIENADNYQLIFTDNPGFTKPANIVHEYMNKKVKESITDGDIILYVVESSLTLDSISSDFTKVQNNLLFKSLKFIKLSLSYSIV